jgi:hypothetical protein
MLSRIDYFETFEFLQNLNSQLFFLKLNAKSDSVFRRILGVGKDLGLIEKAMNDLQNEFSALQAVRFSLRPHNLQNTQFNHAIWNPKKGSLDRTMIKEYLPQLYKRSSQMSADFKAAHNVIKEVTASLDNSEVLEGYQNELLTRIQVKSTQPKS